MGNTFKLGKLVNGLTVLDNGSVGINISSPDPLYNLTTVRFSGSSGNIKLVGDTSTTGSPTIVFYNNATSTSSTLSWGTSGFTMSSNLTANRFIGSITESGSGDSNAPFRFSADYSGWATHLAGTPGSNDGWGIFWAGNSGAQYGTNGTGGPGNIWSNSTNPNEIAFVGNGSTLMSIHGNTGNVWIKGETRIASQFRVNAGSSTTPAAVFTPGGSSWSEGIYINPAPNNYAGVYFPVAENSNEDGLWFTGKISNTVSGFEHAYGIFRKGYSGFASGNGVFAIKQNGTAYFNENVINLKSYKANTYVQLTSSNYGYKTFTWTGNPTGSFAVTDFANVPSNAKAVSVVGWYHITGYGGGAGQGDHAACWFGASTEYPFSSWSGPGAGWPGGYGSYNPAFFGSYVLWHDGDASNTGNGQEYYGYHNSGIVTVNSNGNIYYNLGHGYSGGTHYVALYATGYWI